MRSRILFGVIVLTAAVGTVTLAARGDLGMNKQWALTNFPDPVVVKNILVMGPVLVVHDSEKMSRGEPCTTFYRFKPGAGQKEELVSFHCRPRQAQAVDTTTFTTVATEPGCKRLVEYQIAGDEEAHGVPVK